MYLNLVHVPRRRRRRRCRNTLQKGKFWRRFVDGDRVRVPLRRHRNSIARKPQRRPLLSRERSVRRQKDDLHFSNSTNKETFLPRQLSDSIPFTSTKFPEIFAKFSVTPASAAAEAIKKTISACEDAGVKGEEKLCATSLESMIDFSTAMLGVGGKEVNVVSTRADARGRKAYSVKAARRMMSSEKGVVVCHQLEYVYAVFYCHKTDTTVAYGVSLVAEGGGGGGVPSGYGGVEP